MVITATERLRIEQVEMSDSRFFLNLLNSHNWLAHIGDRGITSQRKASDYIFANILESYTVHNHGLYKVVLVATETPIGVCGLLKRDYLQHADIGFAILPEYEGQGYAFEAAKAVLQYGMESLNLKTILGITTFGNSVSQKLLRKIGLRSIGTINAPDRPETFLMFSS